MKIESQSNSRLFFCLIDHEMHHDFKTKLMYFVIGYEFYLATATPISSNESNKSEFVRQYLLILKNQFHHQFGLPCALKTVLVFLQLL